MIETSGHAACRLRTTEESKAVSQAEQRRYPDADLHRAFWHVDWEYATTDGSRGAWDGADVPPEGEGWVRNVHAGDSGWERFDYTEESYWMRPRRRTM